MAIVREGDLLGLELLEERLESGSRPARRGSEEQRIEKGTECNMVVQQPQSLKRFYNPCFTLSLKCL